MKRKTRKKWKQKWMEKTKAVKTKKIINKNKIQGKYKKNRKLKR